MIPARRTIALLGGLVAGALTAACDPCAELEDRCPNCTDEVERTRCQIHAGEGDADNCERVLESESFQAACPE